MAKRSARRPVMAPESPCPCGLDAAYGDCCGSLHEGRVVAATAELLMRSRYSAFVVQDAAYLLRTWAAGTRPQQLSFDDDLEWTGLDILGSTNGSAFHTEGTVEFRAHFLQDGSSSDQHENSRFAREDGLWVYVSAIGSR